MTVDLEALRQIFRDDADHIGIGTITKLGLAEDFNCLRAQVKLLPEGRELVCEVGFPDPGDVTFPQPGDLVVVAVADIGVDEAFVIARFPTKAAPIPTLARTGHSVKYARAGKKMYLGSDTKVSIGRLDKEGSQPLVLGTAMLSALTDILNAFISVGTVGISSPGGGPVPINPALVTALGNALSKYVTTPSTNVVSQIAFTERGTE